MAGRRRPGDQRCTRGSSLPAGRAAGRYVLTGPEEWSQVSKPGQCQRRAVLAGGLLVLCQHRAARLARASAALPPAKWTARLGNTARSLCTASTLEMIPPGSAPNGGYARGCHGLVHHALRSAPGADAQAHRPPRGSATECLALKAGTRAPRSRTSGRCPVVVIPTYLLAADPDVRSVKGGRYSSASARPRSGQESRSATVWPDLAFGGRPA